MSGIFGIIYRSKITDETLLNANINGMHIWNKVYGMDTEYIDLKDKYGIGYCSQQINPCYNVFTGITSKNMCCAIDAIIYNREELIQQLMSRISVTNNISDEELLFRYIVEFGYFSLKNINGDFAGAVYDKEKEELVLFRDHMGIRPLYYLNSGDFVAFSTDIRGLTGIIEANISLNDKWVYETLSGFASYGVECTEYKDIYCVKPGCFLKFNTGKDAGDIYKRVFWKLGKKKIKKMSDKQYQAELKELIIDAINKRLAVTPGIVGSELSGGLDSGVIGILINRVGKKCVYYSWSYPIESVPIAEHDERLIISDICKQENISCNYDKKMLYESFFFNYQKNSSLYDTNESDIFLGCAFPAYINTSSILEASNFFNTKGVTVVFTGHGGDEGVSHRCNSYEMFHRKEYYHYLRYMFSKTKGNKHRIINTIKLVKKDVKESKKELKKPYISMSKAPDLINKELAKKYFEHKGVSQTFAYDPIKYIENGGSRNRLDVIAFIGAHCGVRYMIPYLDYRVIDFAVSIPRYQFLRGHRNRYIFREAFKDIMPNSLYRLQTKEDFSHRNYMSDPNWGEKFLEKKRDIISRFDITKWSEYLDFTKLEEYAQKDKPSNERALEESLRLNCLKQCLLAQNVIEKSRRVFLDQKKKQKKL